jgi:hypothetical protein
MQFPTANLNQINAQSTSKRMSEPNLLIEFEPKIKFDESVRDPNNLN